MLQQEASGGTPALTDPFSPCKITQGLFYTTQLSEMKTESHTGGGYSHDTN